MAGNRRGARQSREPMPPLAPEIKTLSVIVGGTPVLPIAARAGEPLLSAASIAVSRFLQTGSALMKLLSSLGPNPRIVRMFLLEKNRVDPF